MNPVMAVTLQQPYASLHAHGFKGWETRWWATKHRGTMFIHAATTIKPWAREAVEQSELLQLAIRACGYASLDAMPLGAIVSHAECDLVLFGSDDPIDETDHANNLYDDDLPFGNFGPDRALWRLRKDARRLLEPVKCQGAQGVWRPKQETINQVIAARDVFIPHRWLHELDALRAAIGGAP